MSENVLVESLCAEAYICRYLVADANKTIQNGLNAPEPLRLEASFVLTAHRKPLSISCSANTSAA